MTFRLMIRLLGIVGIALLTGGTFVAAQSADVAIRGVVTDESRAAVPGVTVTATNTETGLQRSTTTDTAGRYTVASIPAGTYDVYLTPTGGARVVIEEKVKVEAGKVSKVE